MNHFSGFSKKKKTFIIQFVSIPPSGSQIFCVVINPFISLDVVCHSSSLIALSNIIVSHMKINELECLHEYYECLSQPQLISIHVSLFLNENGLPFLFRVWLMHFMDFSLFIQLFLVVTWDGTRLVNPFYSTSYYNELFHLNCKNDWNINRMNFLLNKETFFN